MTDMQASNVTPAAPLPVAPRAGEGGWQRPPVSIDDLVPANLPADAAFRARLREIGVSAQQAQVAAGTAWRAQETLSAIQQAMNYALDVAREARDAQSLPDEALASMQKQIDLAISTVDGLAGAASFAGRQLFDGSTTLEVGGKRLELPKVSSSSIGSCRVRPVSDAETADVAGGTVDYSKSIASAGSGGPNSLSFWAGGAVTALEDGIRQIQRCAAAVQGFRAATIDSAVNSVDVMLANAVAAGSQGAGLDAVVTLLASVRKGLDASVAPAASSEGVVRLLE